MIAFKAFQKLISIISGARARITDQHVEFLQFYQELVRIIPPDIAADFRSVKVPTIVNWETHDGYRMELNATDYVWWKSIIEDNGGRFAEGVDQVQRNIWDKLNKLVEKSSLSTSEQLDLLALMDFDNTGS